MTVPYAFGSATTSIPLSQLDANFNTPITLGNTAIQLGNTVTTLNNMTLANATVSSGNVTVTSASLSGNLTFTGTGNRITGDFSNATATSRVSFQSSTTNGATVVQLIPNGTSSSAQFSAYGGSDILNTSVAQLTNNGTDVRFASGIFGTGTYLPMTFYTGGSERMRVDTSGNLGIGTSSPGAKLEVKGASATAGQLSIHDGTGDTTVSGVTAASLLFQARDSSVRTIAEIDAVNTTANGTGGAMVFQTRISDTLAERARIDSSGNLLVGTATDPGGSARLGIKGSGATSSTVSLYIINSSSVGNFLVYDDGGINTGTTSAGSPYVNTTATSANAVLGSDGFLRRSTSSLKYKTDIQNADHGLTDLLKLRSVTYKGKNDGDILFGGLIAEEVHEAGLTEFVQYAEDGSPDALAYGNMVSLCIKAIQEQQQMIETLQAEVAALKGA